jgi:16S rRNA (guanine527-N7)-methyltransferase
VQFSNELARVLPAEIPHRERLIEKAALHLERVAQANEHMNLTRIATPAEAAIKHVVDSVIPWHLFRSARRILDAGTGAGFPGIPLALVLPEIDFALVESTQKKARFVESTSELLELGNVRVFAQRAEELVVRYRPDIITARAIAPLSRIIELFAKALKQGSRLLLYKGPDAAGELSDLHGNRVCAEIVFRYDLPDGLGARTIISVFAAPRRTVPTSRQ